MEIKRNDLPVVKRRMELSKTFIDEINIKQIQVEGSGDVIRRYVDHEQMEFRSVANTII